MITYEDIKKANNAIRTTDIGRGKEYVEVNERIKAFRMLYPGGTIMTEILSNEDGVCVIRATVGYEDEGKFVILATGTAYEKEGSTFINKTSYIENCETSAVGRALGMLGIGIDTSIASAEEVQNAIANQNSDKGLDNWLRMIDAKAKKIGITRKEVFDQVGIKNEKELTLQVFEKIMKKFEVTK